MEGNLRIIPAILTDDLDDLSVKLRQVEAMTDTAQVDFMDGRFVASRSIGPVDLTRLTTPLTLVAHLMVLEPETYVDALAAAGVAKVIFHYESAPDPHTTVQAIARQKMAVGIAINPPTPVAAIEPLLGEVESVLFLAVDPGYYGSPFDPRVLDKIERFHAAHPDATLEIDGGVSRDNIDAMRQLGITHVYVGSGIFGSGDPVDNYRALERAVAAAE